ncbi:hypothetical protein D9Q98_005229 [Chlorella vulgaris]|uniref:Uncharacterized protein n=1 Tax=Chlorella vulgaris TaxID=3077 RepID=A0A9D4TNU0_CHLVU|nr:hypothetical protein D9Q98_005229 [Chlorella vulgaris]
MASLLRGYGLAREQAHFKLEQEADVQRHRQRLVKQGKLDPEAVARDRAAAAAAGASQPFGASEHNYETLAEVLQQQVRVDDPHALRRREYERRVKGEAPPMSAADLRRARSKLHALGSAVGHVPRMSMGRDRYMWQPNGGGAAGGDVALSAIRQLTPEAQEVASRTYVAGVRALVYGSLLGAVGLAGGVTWAVRSSGISSGQELGERVREAFLPLSANMRGWLLPVKHRAQAWLGPPGAASGSLSEASSGGGGVQLDSAAQGEGGAGFGGDGAGGNGGGAAAEFSRRMQQRYNTKGGGGSAVF